MFPLQPPNGFFAMQSGDPYALAAYHYVAALQAGYPAAIPMTQAPSKELVADLCKIIERQSQEIISLRTPIPLAATESPEISKNKGDQSPSSSVTDCDPEEQFEKTADIKTPTVKKSEIVLPKPSPSPPVKQSRALSVIEPPKMKESSPSPADSPRNYEMSGLEVFTARCIGGLCIMITLACTGNPSVC